MLPSLFVVVVLEIQLYESDIGFLISVKFWNRITEARKSCLHFFV